MKINNNFIKTLIFSGIIFVSFFPNFFTDYYFDINRFLKIILYFSFSYLISFFIFNFFHKYEKYIISILLVYVIDLNLNSFVYFKNINFLQNYNFNLAFKILIFFLFFSSILFIIFKILNKKKDINILSFILIFSILLNASHLQYLFFKKDFSESHFNENKKTTNNKKTLIIYLDEMIGLHGIDYKVPSSQILEKTFIDTFKNNGFVIYEKAYTKYLNTSESIPASLNFDYQDNSYNIDNYVEENIFNKYSRWSIKTNLLFNKFKTNEILSIENKAINFCNHENVGYCYRNKIKLSDTKLDNFKPKIKDIIYYSISQSNSFFNKILLKITSNFIEFNYYSTFTFEKMKIENDLNNIHYLIKNSNYSLYFFHLLYPHKPDSIKFDKNLCRFDEKLIRRKFKDLIDEKEQHYQEAICANKNIDVFFDKLKRDKIFNDIDIIIMTDTGRKFSKDLSEPLSVLFAIKSDNVTKNLNIKNYISAQELIYLYFNKKELNEINISEREEKNSIINYFDNKKKKSLNF